jgi:hypothetical protein
MAKASFERRGFARGGSRGQGQGHRRAPQELTQEVQGRAPLLPARPPQRPGACRRGGGPRRVGGAVACSRLAGRGPVAEGTGSWHTGPVPCRNYTQQRDVQLRRRQSGNGSASAWGANQKPRTKGRAWADGVTWPRGSFPWGGWGMAAGGRVPPGGRRPLLAGRGRGQNVPGRPWGAALPVWVQRGGCRRHGASP